MRMIVDLGDFDKSVAVKKARLLRCIDEHRSMSIHMRLAVLFFHAPVLKICSPRGVIEQPPSGFINDPTDLVN
jgi:hypothetical protein